MSKKILVIDDIREFDGAVHAKSSKLGIEMFKSQVWDEVWLDHDLGGNDTIKPVVEYLEWGAELCSNPQEFPIIRVITSNPSNKDAIIQALLNAGYNVSYAWNAENLPLRRIK